MLKQILFLAFFCISILNTKGQSLSDIQTPKIISPSPDAAALGKYGEIPVDKSTGVPQISIPLYQIKTPRFSIPISISYHSSGIKVEEVSSWVGTGWTLNAGGLITRGIIGFPDDGPYGFLTNHASIKKAADIQWPSDYRYVAKVVNKLLDTEPDNFYYNFNNHAGSFVFGDDTKTLLTLYAPIKINFTASSKNFDITDEEGNKYYFNTKENVISDINVNMSGISSWYLTQMISSDLSDTIKFTYTADATSQIEYSYNFSQQISPVNNTNLLQPMVKTQSMRQFNAMRINSIQFNGGKVDFIAKAGRLDNGVMSLDSVIISNFDYNLNQYNRVKSFKLLNDYFYSTVPLPPNLSTVNLYRLKLTGLQENDRNNIAIRTHQFDYNAKVLPPVHCYAQDKWGYYNGKTQNQTLLEAKTASILNNQLQPVAILIGGTEGADRSISPSDMQAGILQKITYPTKGYTIFSYENNLQTMTEMVTTTLMAAGIGLHQETETKMYTPTNNMILSGGNIFHIKLRRGNDNPTSPLPYIKIIRVSDGIGIYSITASQIDNIDQKIALNLSVGVQYQITAVAQGGSDLTSGLLPYATITTTYQAPSGLNITNVGGLRIGTIKNYNNDGSIINTETYKYGINESGSGDPLSAIPLYNYSSQAYGLSHITQICCQGMGLGSVNSISLSTYSNNSVYPMTTSNGSPVAYPSVTVYNGDLSQNIGKSVYNYKVYTDSILLCNCNNQYNNGLKLIGMTWKNGGPISESHYRSNGNNQYTLVQSKINTYSFISRKTGIGTTIGFNPQPIDYNFLAPQVGTDGQVYTQIENGSYSAPLRWKQSDFYWFDYPISTGSRVLTQTVANNYLADGSSGLQETTQYFYDNATHMLPTRIQTTNSKSEVLLKQLNYPQDMVNAAKDPTGTYSTMSTANIINPVIENYEFKNGVQVLKSKTNYTTFNTVMTKPQSVELQTMASVSEIRLQNLSYDSKGNIQVVTKSNDFKTSYKWGYNQQYPIVEIKNADQNEFYYEGFEENNLGISGLTHTGNYYYSGNNYRVNWPVPNAKNYVISYWYLSGTVWKYSNEETFTGTLTLNSGTGYDDIRIYPKDAQMSTYTYVPLIGVTSQSDVNSRAIYYEYDNFQRLTLIRDQDKNIIKKFCYNYSGQVENCSGLFYNTLQTGQVYTRNNCGSGYTSGTYTSKVSANTYSSAISLADANQQAQNYLSTVGQSNANLNGTCSPVFYNTAQSGTVYTRNNCGSGYIGGSYTTSIIANSYSSLVSVADANQQAKNYLSSIGQNNANQFGICRQIFYNTQQSATYRRNNCGLRSLGGLYTTTVVANTYSSMISVADANQKAQSYLSLIGQRNANINGSCTSSGGGRNP